MIASRFNLDHRLAELRQAGEGFDVQAHRSSQASSRSAGLLGAIRSVFGAQAAGRPARMATH